MEAVARELDSKLRQWEPQLSDEVRRIVAQIIEWADADALDLMRPRTVEQEVLDALDEPTSR